MMIFKLLLRQQNPIVAVEHAIAFESNKHVVMVTVEADAFCGPLLAKKAHEKNEFTVLHMAINRL